jgi:hypothetical protein
MEGKMKGLLGIVILVLDVLAVLDCIKSNKSGGQKALWVIVILVLPVVGLVLYYLIGKK